MKSKIAILFIFFLPINSHLYSQEFETQTNQKIDPLSQSTNISETVNNAIFREFKNNNNFPIIKNKTIKKKGKRKLRKRQ